MLAEGEEIPKIEKYIISKRIFQHRLLLLYICWCAATSAAAPERAIRHDHSFHLFYAVHVRGKTNCVELWYPSMLLGNLLSSVREPPITEVVAPIDFPSLNRCFTPSRVKHLIIHSYTVICHTPSGHPSATSQRDRFWGSRPRMRTGDPRMRTGAGCCHCVSALGDCHHQNAPPQSPRQ